MASYDTQTALLVIDVQNDFADPSGSLSVAGAAEVIQVINAEVEAALAAGAHVFYTQDWHPPATPHFEKDGGIWPVHCVAGTWGAEFHPDLRVDGVVVRKGRNGEDGYSGFSLRDPQSGTTEPTELEGLLRAAGVGRVVIVGLATDYCVLATGLDARAHGLETVVLASAVRAVELTAGDGERALADLRRAGASVEAAPEHLAAGTGTAEGH